MSRPPNQRSKPLKPRLLAESAEDLQSVGVNDPAPIIPPPIDEYADWDDDETPAETAKQAEAASQRLQRKAEQAAQAKAASIRRPIWTQWRDMKFAALWQGALLTLNLEASSAQIERLAKGDRETLGLYEVRLAVLNRRYGHDDLLPEINHVLTGLKPEERMVELSLLLQFAHSLSWAGLEPLAQALIEQREVEQSIAVISEDDADENKILWRNDKIRIVSMMLAIKKWALIGKIPDRMVIPEVKKKAYRLNISLLGAEMDVAFKEDVDVTKVSTAGEAHRKRLKAIEEEVRKLF